MSFQNNFILFRTMVMYEWYMAYVRMVHGLCTNGTWPMYESYMAYVRIVHGYYTKLKKAPINAFFCGFYGDFRS